MQVAPTAAHCTGGPSLRDSHRQTNIASSVALSALTFVAQFSPQRRHGSQTGKGFSSHSRASSCASLLFDLEDDESTGIEYQTKAPTLPKELQTVITPKGGVTQLWHDALTARDQLAADAKESSVDIRAFSQALADRGHLTWLRNGVFSCPPDSGLGTIKHTFVVTSVQPDSSSQPIYCVIDPNWKEHFELSGSGSEEYMQLLSMLPAVFIGCADKLAKFVNLLCKEMEKVFFARGVPLPPWRSPRVMQGRWLVSQADDEHVPPRSGSLPSPRSSITARLN